MPLVQRGGRFGYAYWHCLGTRWWVCSSRGETWMDEEKVAETVAIAVKRGTD